MADDIKRHVRWALRYLEMAQKNMPDGNSPVANIEHEIEHALSFVEDAIDELKKILPEEDEL